MTTLSPYTVFALLSRFRSPSECPAADYDDGTYSAGDFGLGCPDEISLLANVGLAEAALLLVSILAILAGIVIFWRSSKKRRQPVANAKDESLPQ